VGDEVYEQFAAAGYPMAQIARRYAKWHIDLWACCRLQLQDMGLKAENIQTSGVCTYAHSDDYFSARRLGIDSGRILTAVLLH
jgi:copper oxidase (laccase) domain-containing protein